MFNKSLFIVSAFILFSCGATKTASSHFVFKDSKAEQKYITSYNNTMKLWPVSYEEKDINTSFGTAHVIISGPTSGEPLVLLHGMDASSTMWYPNIGDYAKKYRVYTIDYLMEPGKSVSKGDKLNTDEIISWYDQVFNNLGLEQFNLVGMSRGGWMATHYTLHSKDRIKKLILLAPVQTFNNIEVDTKTMTAANFKFFPNRNNLKKAVNALSRRPEKIAPAFKEQMYLGVKNTKSNFDMLQMTPFSKKELESLTLPVLVLVGDHDILNNSNIVEKAGKILPKINAAVIEDAGHFLTIDQKDEVDRRIIEFLDTKK